MSKTFLQSLQDETLRIEVGAAAVSGLAVENLELSTPGLSQAVRRSVIQRRASDQVATVTTGRTADLLTMHQVMLPAEIASVEYCAA
jgi:hypothetical protein